MKSISISFEGDEQDRQALKHVAFLRGTTMAVLVREAIEAACGSELKSARERLFATSDISRKNHREPQKA